jgi:putative peptide maturation dehydrogenase
VNPAAPARWIRRAGRCFIECGERPWIDLGALLRGDLRREMLPELRLHMPPGTAGSPVTAEEAQVLLACPRGSWVAADRFPADTVAALLERGWVRACDDATRPPPDPAPGDGLDDWFGPAALLHFASRWEGVVARQDLPADAALAGSAYRLSAEGFASDAAQRGPAPTHRHERGDDVHSIALPRADARAFDALLDARETHRLFDPERPLALAELARLLERSFATRAEAPMGGGLVAQRKHAPSGGGLHPVEAHVLASNVEGLATGWYHYRSHQHRLAPVAGVAKHEVRDCIVRLTAGQAYYRDAAALVALSLRFPRHHWKYPRHAKAYRVMLLDAGHVGQVFALAATEAGLGAFITAAVNEVDADRMLGLDGIDEGVVALLGCGHPAAGGEVLRLSNYVAPR